MVQHVPGIPARIQVANDQQVPGLEILGDELDPLVAARPVRTNRDLEELADRDGGRIHLQGEEALRFPSHRRKEEASDQAAEACQAPRP